MYKNSADFDFEADLKWTENLDDYSERKLYLNDKKFDFLQFRVSHPGFVDNTYLKCICLEAKRLDLTEEIIRKREEAISKNEASKLFGVPPNNQPAPGNTEIILTEESIMAFSFSRINAMHKKKMNYFFFNEGDAGVFLKAIAEYFISGKCTMPRMVLQKHCKTRLCIALYSIYHLYRKEVPLNEYSSFIKLLKILPAFEKHTNHQIYKSLTRECG